MASPSTGYRASDARSAARHPAYLLAGLAALVFALYAQTISYPFVYEDPQQNPMRWPGWSAAGFRLLHPGRFLSNLSFYGTHAISVQPWIDHLFSVSVHTLNTVLLVLAAFPIFGLSALWMGLLFGIHPLQSEAVSYISARPDLLVGTGVLMALCGVTYRRGWLLIVGLVIAALSKETGVMAAPLAVLWARRTQQSIAPITVWVLAGCAVLLLIGHAVEFPLLGSPLEIGRHLAMLWRLLAFAVLPVGLTIDHDWIWITTPLACGASAAWLGVLLFSDEHPASWLGFGLVFALIALLPRLLLHDPEPLHEHHTYVSLIGLCVAAPLAYQQAANWVSDSHDWMVCV